MSNQYIGEIHWNLDWDIFYWDKVGANIIRDGYTEWGLRVHVIDREQPPTIVDNALVMSLDYLGVYHE